MELKNLKSGFNFTRYLGRNIKFGSCLDLVDLSIKDVKLLNYKLYKAKAYGKHYYQLKGRELTITFEIDNPNLFGVRCLIDSYSMASNLNITRAREIIFFLYRLSIGEDIVVDGVKMSFNDRRNAMKSIKVLTIIDKYLAVCNKMSIKANEKFEKLMEIAYETNEVYNAIEGNTIEGVVPIGEYQDIEESITTNKNIKYKNMSLSIEKVFTFEKRTEIPNTSDNKPQKKYRKTEISYKKA